MTVTAISAGARGRLAERLVPVALEFAGVVRSEDADGVGEFLSALTPEEREVLPVVLAAMVDVDQTPQRLLSWVTWDERERPLPEGAQMVLWSPPRPRARPGPSQPCGTPGGCQRHYRHDERPCEPCRLAWREDQNRRRAEEKQQREEAEASAA